MCIKGHVHKEVPSHVERGLMLWLLPLARLVVSQLGEIVYLHFHSADLIDELEDFYIFGTCELADRYKLNQSIRGTHMVLILTGDMLTESQFAEKKKENSPIFDIMYFHFASYI